MAWSGCESTWLCGKSGSWGVDPFHNGFISHYRNFGEKKYCSHLKHTDQIISQFCTCHDSSADVACTKLWHDLIIMNKITTRWISTRFQLWVHKFFVKWIWYHGNFLTIHRKSWAVMATTQIARFTWPTWGPPGSCRPQVGPMSVPWTLLSGKLIINTLPVAMITTSGVPSHNKIVTMMAFLFPLLQSGRD